jgi:hypothetical protein
MVGPIIVNQGKVVRPSQLIASVRQLLEGGESPSVAQRNKPRGNVAPRLASSQLAGVQVPLATVVAA